MIELDETKKEIRFAPEEMEGEHPPARRFPLLSGYVCPFCKKILAAYFQGYLSESDIEYYTNDRRYSIGSVPGGHYLKVERHGGASYYGDSEKCPWEAFCGRGVAENLRRFCQRQELSSELVEHLARKIGQIPGFVLVRDVCGRDAEMLLFSEQELFGDLRKKDFDACWEAKGKMGGYLAGLA